MPADPTPAHSHDRSRHCLTLTASARPNGECGRVVRISPRRRTNLSLVRAIYHCASVRPYDPPWTLAARISMFRVIAEEGGS
jgi:hypothetical protein